MAKKTGGKFVIRIEDTDLARSTKESEESMIADLKWLGLDWDEGPFVGGPAGQYRQSERNDIYKVMAERLVKEGWAYPCFCTEEELEAKRKAAEASGAQVAYDGTWRDADPAEVQRRIDAGEPYTYRFKVPAGKVVTINDQVRGRISWDVEATLGDFILLRSNGVPVYNFCVAVDDALMGVTTVARAEEHLTNTVRQALVLEALGFELPEYAHCSLILGEDRSKLSKRHGATSCDQFRREGYLPDAMINYLALLGWNDGTDKDIYTREELIQAFDLARVTPSPAMFDTSKLRWINGQHLRGLPQETFAQMLGEVLQREGVLATPTDVLLQHVAGMTQEKCELLNDAVPILQNVLDYRIAATSESDEARAILADDFQSLADAIVESYNKGEIAPEAAGDDFEAKFKEWVNALGKATGRKGKRLFMPVRLAVTGNLAGPDIGAQLKTLSLVDGCGPQTAVVPFQERMALLQAFCAEHKTLLDADVPAAQGGAGQGKAAQVPDDALPAKIMEAVARLGAAQQRQVLATAQELAAQGGAAAKGVSAKPKAASGPVVDRSGNIEPVTRLDVRVGRVVSCEKHPDADALYLEQIDVGDPTGPRQVISGLANFIPLEEMQGRMVTVLCNLKPMKMRGIESSGMVLCGSNADHTQVEILEPPEGSEPGEHLFLDSFGPMKPTEADLVLKSKSQQNVWKMVAPDMKLDTQGRAVYRDKLFSTSKGSLTCKSLKDCNVG